MPLAAAWLLLVPMVVSVVGVVWIQVGAWRFKGEGAGGHAVVGSLTLPLAAGVPVKRRSRTHPRTSPFESLDVTSVTKSLGSGLRTR
jgi:hypothetical protein